jgi:hypothetical protein
MNWSTLRATTGSLPKIKTNMVVQRSGNLWPLTQHEVTPESVRDG